MKKNKISDQEAFGVLLQIEDETTSGITLATACHKAGICDSTYYNWRKKYQHLRPAVVEENKELKKENARLRKTISDISEEIRTLQQNLRKITSNS